MRNVIDKDEHFERMYEEIANAGIPFQDLARFPDKEKWLDVISTRQRGVAPEVEQEPEEIQRIKRILETRTVTLSFNDTDLAGVLSFLQDITGLNIVIDPNIDAEVTLTLRLKDIVMKNALQLIMDQTGYMYIFKENTIFVTEKGAIPGEGILEIYNISDILAKIPNFVGPDIKVYDPEEQGGGGGGGLGGGISFDDDEEEDEGEPLDPDSLIELIKAATGEDNWPEEAGGFGTISHHRGQLIVINTRDIHKKVAAILDNLRRNTGIFVVMEVRFIDITDDFLEDIGVDYRGLGNGGSTLGTPFAMIANQSGGTDAGITKRNPGRFEDYAGRLQHMFDIQNFMLPGNRIIPQVDGGLWLSSTWIDPFQVNAILHAREETLKLHRMASAIVTAHNAQRVYISILLQRAYVADYDIMAIPGMPPMEIADPIIRCFQEGLVLDVRPVVSSDRKYITIDVRPTYSALTTPTISTIFINIGTYTRTVINADVLEIPEIFIERAFTSVTIPDGGTAIIGGLKEVTERKRVTSIPILDKIPILNWIFKRKGYVNERRNLAILITGRIVIIREEEKAQFGTE